MRLEQTRCRGYSQMRVKRRWDHGGIEPKSKRGRRKREGDPITQNRRSDYARPWITQGHGLQHRERVWTTTQVGTNKRIYTYGCKQITAQGITARNGHGLDTSEQGGEQMPMPVRYDVRRENRSEVLPNVHGRSSKQREPPRNPAMESDGAETEREQRKNRERSL